MLPKDLVELLQIRRVKLPFGMVPCVFFKSGLKPLLQAAEAEGVSAQKPCGEVVGVAKFRNTKRSHLRVGKPHLRRADRARHMLDHLGQCRAFALSDLLILRYDLRRKHGELLVFHHKLLVCRSQLLVLGLSVL